MKLLLTLSMLLTLSEAIANDKLDYSLRIGATTRAEQSPATVIIESINKGVFKPNDYLLSRDGTVNKLSLGGILAQTFLFITDPNFLEVTKENTRGLKFLLDKGLDPNQLTKDDYYNLFISASHSCNLDAVKFLISKGVNPHQSIPDKFLPTVSTRELNGANAASDSHFNYITQDLPIEQDACFNTFKYFVEEIGFDIKNHGCMAFTFPETDDKAIVRYSNYMNSKFGPSFETECKKLDDKLMKEADF